MDLDIGRGASTLSAGQFSSHISGDDEHIIIDRAESTIEDIQGHAPPISDELPLISDLFCILLFAMLFCWVVLTSAFVMSVHKSCDVPLNAYFWLVTFQLVLDVFRNDIICFVFNWDARSNQRMPARVIIYNVAYWIYALMALRLGVRSVCLR